MLRKSAIVCAVAGFLTACGGGGVSTPAAPEPVVPPAVNTAPSNVGLVALTAQDGVSLSAVWLPATDVQTASELLKYELHVSDSGAAPTLRSRPPP